ncbi:hypothetical protein M885DRAFT_521685 [Pelagophyceae sp. CCMP2097]|nr:hypothetical protein M885DRAFT_521685 [Pelagophyceae sp. CCMP2097]
MGGLNEAARAGGGRIVSVIHECFIVDGQEFENVDEMIVAQGDDLGERKRLLLAHADVVVCLPGGVGTLDELWDAASSRQLGFKVAKPICILNLDGYFAGTLMQLDRAASEGLLSKAPWEIFHVVSSAEEALAWCVAHDPATHAAATTDATLLRKRAKSDA